MEHEYQYFALSSGEYISKREVDAAFRVVNKLSSCIATLVNLNDDQLIEHGNYYDAVMAFHRKYDCGLAEAKEAIDFLRARGRYE